MSDELEAMKRRRKGLSGFSDLDGIISGLETNNMFGKKDRLLKQQYADARRIMAKVPVSKRKKNNGPS